MNQICIPLDNGDGGLLHELTQEVERMKATIIGQGVRFDGMPMLIVGIKTKDDTAAEINLRRISANYDLNRIAA